MALAALERLKTFPYLLLGGGGGGGKSCQHSRACIFDWILLILTGNKDNYKSLDEFGGIPPLTSELAALEC